MNDENWKALQKLPVDQKRKARIYEEVMQEPQKPRLRVRELVITCAVLLLAVFLFVTPQMQQTASSTSAAIYAYSNTSNEEFLALPSTLYTGIVKLEDPQLLAFLSDIYEHAEPIEEKEAFYYTDVLFIQDGQEHRYKFGYEGFMNVDTGQQYIGSSFTYRELASMLDVREPSNFYWFILVLLLINGGRLFSYKYVKLAQPKFSQWFYIIQVLCVFTLLYGLRVNFTDGFMYKPAIVLLFIGYGFVQTIILCWQLKHPTHRRIELTMHWLIICTMCLGFWSL